MGEDKTLKVKLIGFTKTANGKEKREKFNNYPNFFIVVKKIKKVFSMTRDKKTEKQFIKRTCPSGATKQDYFKKYEF